MKRACLAAAAALLTLACGEGEERGAGPLPAEPPAVASADSGPGLLAGTWRVVADSAPGVLALDEAQARERYGWEARFAAGAVSFGPHRCAAPSFASAVLSADSFFDVGYRTTAAAAGIRPDGGGRLRLTEIRCGGEPWLAPSGHVLWSGADTITLVDGGVFFHLVRQP